MGYIYAAFSHELNERSLTEVGQIYLFKFGFAKARWDLEDRLNLGFEERRRRKAKGARSASLALCHDWQVIECIEHNPDRDAKNVETAIHDWCRRHFSAFILLDKLKAEVNAHAGQPYPSATYVSWNGLGDIVCLDHDRVADASYLASIGRPNDLLGHRIVERAIERVRLELRTFEIGLKQQPATPFSPSELAGATNLGIANPKSERWTTLEAEGVP